MKKQFKFSETLMHHLDNTAKISRVLGARYFDNHNEFDITYNNFLIIELLYTNPDIHQRNIARALLMGTANLSKELEKMESKTMVMLISTGVGVMVLLIISILMLFTSGM